VDSLYKYRKNYFSQNGEDGVLEEILSRLDIKSGWCVEFGAWDGKTFSNTFHLLQSSDWRGIGIEGDAGKFEELAHTAHETDGRLIPLNAYVSTVGSNTLDSLLGTTELPVDFDVLSIDIDSRGYPSDRTSLRPCLDFMRASITQGPMLNSSRGSGLTPTASTTWSGCAGRRATSARSASARALG
jgi:hypothetical protein